jgi:Fe-S-cluster-containing dehydrogenase component
MTALVPNNDASPSGRDGRGPKKWNMVIDLALCNDCNCCFMADKDEFTGNEWLPFSKAQPWEGARWIQIERKERGQYPQIQVVHRPALCMHCDDAPCIEAAPAGALYKRADGLVIIDPDKAAGHPDIVDSCPYGAINWNDELNVAQKCTGCAHLVDEGWTQTRCSQGCPTGAMTLVLADDAEMAALARDKGLEAYRADLKTRPRVHYKDLYRWTKAFVAGSAYFADSGDCAGGCKVTISKGDAVVAAATTNNFGDFCVDGLDAGAEYTIAIAAAGYRPVERRVVPTAASLTLPAVGLERA